MLLDAACVILSWLNWLQISLSLWGCCCLQFSLAYAGCIFFTFLVGRFRVSLLLFSCEFDPGSCFALCVAREQALLGFSIRSHQSAPGELARRLCFVPREWSHILSVCGVCCMFYCGWSVACFLLDNALLGCTCVWYRLNASRPCFGCMVASVLPDLSSW